MARITYQTSRQRTRRDEAFATQVQRIMGKPQPAPVKLDADRFDAPDGGESEIEARRRAA